MNVRTNRHITYFALAGGVIPIAFGTLPALAKITLPFGVILTLWPTVLLSFVWGASPLESYAKLGLAYASNILLYATVGFLVGKLLPRARLSLQVER